MPLPSAIVGGPPVEWRGRIDARWLMAYAAAIGCTDDAYFDTLAPGGVTGAAGLPGIILHGTATLAHGVTACLESLGRGPGDVARLGGMFRSVVALPAMMVVRAGASADGQRASFTVMTHDEGPAVRDGFVVLR
jgi:hypothetical protein